MRQDLQIDAGLIHLADAQCAEIVKPLNDLATRAWTRAELFDLRVLVMFFERDDVRLLCHSRVPSYRLRAALLVAQSPAFQQKFHRLCDPSFRVIDRPWHRVSPNEN